jgi:hypothetical protein
VAVQVGAGLIALGAVSRAATSGESGN